MMQPHMMAQMVMNPPAMEETQVRSLVREDPLEREMATHSNILAQSIPWMEEPLHFSRRVYLELD